MSTTTFTPPVATLNPSSARMSCLLTREQYFTLARLQGLLQRRDDVDACRLTAAPEDEVWLVRGLDAAIVSYYRLALTLGVEADANELISVYRHFGLGQRSTC